jgi:5-formyltetrahydrofolate cyclo-ligase
LIDPDKGASLKSVDQEKQQLRQRTWARLEAARVSPPSTGQIPVFDRASRAAQRLRSVKQYQEARVVMAVPDQALIQARINCLTDGKDLVMATPALRSGFVSLKAGRIRPGDRDEAARSSLAKKYGLQMGPDDLPRLDLMLTGAVAVDNRGRRLGKGEGYFDLEYLILLASGRIQAEVSIIALIHDLQIVDQVPDVPGDVAVDVIVTPSRVLWAVDRPIRPKRIDWGRLPRSKIKKMTPLFHMRGKQT